MAFDTENEQNNKIHVILLKTNDYQNSSSTVLPWTQHSDRYMDYLLNENIKNIERIDRINLLSFEYINIDILKKKIIQLFKCDVNHHKSLILTSRQTIEAFEIALQQIIDDDINIDKNEEEFLNNIYVYCVGNATASRFTNLMDKITENPIGRNYIKEERIVIKQVSSQVKENEPVEHKQNGYQMAKLLIEDYQFLNNKNSISSIFYPCSSIRKDDLSNELRKADIAFDELHVYKTTHSQTGLNNLKSILLKDKVNHFGGYICPVFFSPSCVDAVFNNNNDNIGKECPNNSEIVPPMIFENVQKFRMISIGPSTSAELRKYVNEIFELSETSPQALLKILNYF